MTSRTGSLFFRGFLLLAVLSLLGAAIAAGVTFLSVRGSFVVPDEQGATTTPLTPQLFGADTATMSALRAAAFMLAVGMVLTMLVIAGLAIPARHVRARLKAMQQHLTVISASGRGQPVHVEGRDELATLELGIHRAVAALRERVAEAESVTVDRCESLQAHLHAYRAVARIVDVISAIDSLPEVLSTAVALLVETLRFDHVGFFLIDEVTGQPVLRAVSSERTRDRLVFRHAMGVDDSLLARAIQTGLPQSELVTDADTLLDMKGDRGKRGLWVVVPAKACNRVVGVIGVELPDAGAFSDDVVAALSLLADRIGLVVADSRGEEEGRAIPDVTRIHPTAENLPGEMGTDTSVAAFHFNGLDAVPVSASAVATRVTQAEVVERTDGTRELRTPIIIGDRILGSLALRQPAQAPAWGEEALAFAVSVSGQVGQAIEHARLLGESKARDGWRARQEQLVQRLWASATDQGAIVTTVVGELGSAFGARGVLLQASPQGGAEAPGQDGRGAPFRTDVEVGEGGRLLVPLHSRGGYVGTISLERDAHRLPWTVEELALARMASVQTGLALDRVLQAAEEARRREAAEQRLRQEHEVIDVMQRLDTLSGTDTLLRMATRELQTLLGASTVTVRVGPLVPPFMDDPGPAEPDPMSRGQEADHDD